jgi:hypothetical protein
MALRSTQPLTEMSTRSLPGGKRRPARKGWQPYRHLWADCLEKMWEPQRLTTLWTFTACYRDSFYSRHQINSLVYRLFNCSCHSRLSVHFIIQIKATTSMEQSRLGLKIYTFYFCSETLLLCSQMSSFRPWPTRLNQVPCPQDSFQYHPKILISVSQVISSRNMLWLKLCMYFSFLPCVLHDSLISSSLTLFAEAYKLWSSCYIIFPFSPLLPPSWDHLFSSKNWLYTPWAGSDRREETTGKTKAQVGV